ncbi:transmembrane protein 132C [Myotis myotis]|uniref:transmembrane protein 132C n=1 Tax=Myotis myotis TaxID=51298 RepID=UPI00174D2F18|nr:transmembrane protein 132C [Myotis myotis]
MDLRTPEAPVTILFFFPFPSLPPAVIEGRGVPGPIQRFSSPPPYLPVSFRVLGADTSFLLREARRDPALNASLQARVESFFTYRARRPPRVNASCGPFSVEKAVPLDSTLTLTSPGPTEKSSFDWKLRAHILQDKIYPGRPVAQVLFHVLGRDWAEPGPAEPLPCLRVFAFRETREVRAGCRLRGALGLCVAELRLPPAWFSAPAVVAGRRRPAGPAEGSPVELYYTVHPGDHGHGDCAGGDLRKGNAIRPGKDGREDAASLLQRVGAVRLYRAQDRGDQLSELRLGGGVAVWLPSRPAKQGDVVTAYVTVAGNSTVDLFTLRAKVKKGVNVLSARPSEPSQWAVRQELGAGGKHSTSTVVCQRLGPGAHNRSSALTEVVQLSFEIAGFSSLSGSQPIAWQLESPRTGASGSAVSELFISQQDLVGIVPLATDSELLNTAILTGRTVALPLRVVSVEESGAVADISESVECTSADEDVLKVSDRCDYVFVNGKEMKGKVDAVVTFTYQHLSAPLHVTVWAPQLPLQIEVSDTELSQIKGWRVPIAASKRPERASEDQDQDEDEDARRGRGCALQYQRATVRVLTRFLAEGAGPWAQPRLLLGPDWQVDITHLVADVMKLEAPRVAALLDGRVLVGREVGMTTIQVLSPLSDSILAEKTVTVLEDRVSLTDLAVQLVAGLSLTLHPSTENGRVVTAVAEADELLRAPKQEAVVSVWLRFSDGSMAPLDIYDGRDFTLSASSLDAAVVSTPPARTPGWPVVAAEGEGQGPLVRVDLSIAETCQKSKRRSVLAGGTGSIRVKFGPKDADLGPGRGGAEAAAAEEDEEDEEGEIRNQASDQRPKGAEAERAGPDAPREREEGTPRQGGPTARPLLDNKAARSSRLDAARPPADGRVQNIPLDLSHFPAPAGAGAGRAGGGLVSGMGMPGAPGARGLSDLQIGMFALLGVFCLAILVFLVNCSAFALRFRRKQLPPEGPAAPGATHSHDWVWLGHETELLDGAGQGSPPPPSPPPPPEERTTVLDRGPVGGEDSSRLRLHGGGSPKPAQGQAPRPAADPGGWPGRDPRREPPPSPGSRRRKVQFAAISPEGGGGPTANSVPSGRDEDLTWVCPDLGGGAPHELRNYLEKFKDGV